MPQNVTIHRKRSLGHTLIELVTAMVASAVLLAGLGSVMLIGRRIAYTPTTAAHRLEAAKLLNQLAGDLRTATLIIEQSPFVLDFVVADRNSDGVAERIRYQWSGTAGAPLTRAVNGGAPLNVLDSVQEFLVTPITQSKSTTLKTNVDSSEVLLTSNATISSGSNRDIASTTPLSQQVNPAAFAAAPANATAWNATRAEFYGRQRDNINFYVQLCRSGDPNNGPTSNVVAQSIVPGSSITSGFGWNSAVFTSPARGLALYRKFDLVFASAAGGNAARLLVTDGAGSGGVLESSDGGATWSYTTDRQTYYRLFGTYTTPGASYDVTRTYVRQVRLLLRSGGDTSAHIDTGVPLDNLPELLSNYWRLDFDNNPTNLDADADGVLDWAKTGTPFVAGDLSAGIWTATGTLETRPLNDFIRVTTVDVSCRNTSLGGNGAVVRINADRQSGLFAPVFTYLQLQADGTQTLSLYGSNSSSNVLLFSRPRLPNALTRIRLTIDPANNIVNLQINGEDQGTFTYPTFAPSANDGYVTIYADTGSAQFDYAEVRRGGPVADGAPNACRLFANLLGHTGRPPPAPRYDAD